MPMQTKAQCKLIEVKLAPSDAGVMEFSGYGAVFGNVDSYGDMIQQGAFDQFITDVKSGGQQWPVMLLQHGGWGMNANDMTPVGVWTDMAEDETGLKLTGRFADTQTGNESYKLLKMEPRPAITGLSIGYYAREVAYGGKTDGYDRLIKRIDVMEISLVTFPANDKARVTGVKSAQDYREKDFERLMRDAGFTKKDAMSITEHGFKHFLSRRDAGNEELKAIQDLLKRNINLINTKG